MTPEERLARWSAPLASPCADPRQHPSFELVRSELAKLESPSGGATDWAEVARVGDAFLAETGRDLIVASALAAALAHREGVNGAALGARLLARLVADASTTPTRARARANAIGAFAARVEIALEAAKDRTREPLETLERAVRELSDASRALGDDAPDLGGVRERVRRTLEALPAPPAPPASAPPPASPPAVFASPPPMPSASPVPGVDAVLPDRAEQVPAFVRRVSGQLVAAAALARSTSPIDADALRLTLVALYLPITCVPETTRDARTALTAPPKLVLESLAKRESSAAPDAVVREALAALERSRFALDLHPVISRALERAGASAALAVHRHEVRGLIARLPELLDREFADGTRFASADTRAFFASWEPATSVTASELDVPTAEISALARSGRTGDALTTGTRLRACAISGRARFELTLAMASATEDARNLGLAAELHGALIADVDRHDLESWDPELAARALRAAVRVSAAIPGSEALARSLFARLARVDPRAALEISSTVHATPPKQGR